MTTWNLEALRDAVEKLHGPAQKKAINPSLNSLVLRMKFVSYHYHEAARLLANATAPHTGSGAMARLLLGNDAASEQFEDARLQATAHITSCVQSMHSVADTLAHTVYFALGMNLAQATRLKPRLIGMARVIQLLPIGPLHDLIKTLVEHDDFRYFSALNNLGKHHSIVDTPYSLDLEQDGRPHGLVFVSFENDTKSFEERWAMHALKLEGARQSLLIIEIGRSLNAALSANG